MKVNLLVPGFAKSGTSSLHQYLDLHPEVCMSSRKEPHYFSLPESYGRGVAWYESLFDHADPRARVFGESSTSYSTWEPALVRIRQQLGHPKMILILRDPLDRLLSHYRWMYAIGLENLSLSKALKAESRMRYDVDFHRRGCYPWYFKKSQYSYYVPLIQFLFGRDNLLLIRTEDLAQDPRRVLDVCFDFLGVEPFDIGSIRVETNRTDDQRALWAGGLVTLQGKLPGRIKRRIKPLIRRTIAMMGSRKRVAPEPDPALLRNLRIRLEKDFEEYQKIPSLTG